MNCIHPTSFASIIPAILLLLSIASQAMAAERTVVPLPPVESFTEDDRPNSYWDGAHRWDYPWGYNRPENASRIYPLVVFGPWNEGSTNFNDDIRKRYPAFHVSFNKDASEAKGVEISNGIDACIANKGFRIDLNRIYLTGFSKGGSGSYKTIRGMLSKGKCFAGLIRIAGQSESVLAEGAVNKIAISMHIGLKDSQQRIDISRALYNYIRNHSANTGAVETILNEPEFGRTTKVLTLDGVDVIRYSEYPDMGHSTGVPYSDPALYSWIMTRAIGTPVSNNPPSMQSPGDQSIQAGQSLQLQVYATDPNDDPLTYSASGTVP